MALIGLLALAGATALQPAAVPTRTSSASLSVGATVIRPQGAPRIEVSEGRAIVVDVSHAAVSAEGGTVSRAPDGTLRVTPAGSGPVVVTVTY